MHALPVPLVFLYAFLNVAIYIALCMWQYRRNIMHALPVPLVFFICILKCSHIYCTVHVAVQEKYNACTSSATCFFYMHS